MSNESSGTAGLVFGTALFVALGVGAPVFLFNQAEVDKAATEAEEAAKAKSAAESERVEFQKKLRATEGQRSVLSRNLASTRGDLEETRRSLSSAETELATRKKSLDSLNADLATRVRELDAARKERLKTAEAATRTKNELTTAKAEVGELKDQLAKSRREADRRALELKEQLDKSRREAERRSRELKDQLAKSRSEAERRGAELETAQQEAAATSRKLENSQKEVAGIKRTLDASRNEVETLKAKVEHLNADAKRAELRRREALEASKRALSRFQRETKAKNAALETLALERKKAQAATRRLETLATEAKDARTQVDKERRVRKEATRRADEAWAQAERNLADYARIADAMRARRLQDEATQLMPATSAKRAAIDAWLARAQKLVGRLDGHEKALSESRSTALPYTEEQRNQDDVELARRHPGKIDRVKKLRRLLAQGVSASERKRHEKELAGLRALLEQRLTWKFKDASDQFRHDTLQQLVEDVATLKETAAELRQGRETSAAPRPARKVKWASAIRAIATQPEYAGLRLAPQPGLVPLGRDPQSGLWEFADIESGRLPLRHPRTGEVVVGEKTARIFVLLPVQDDKSSFFISKHEMTEQQWAETVKAHR